MCHADHHDPPAPPEGALVPSPRGLPARLGMRAVGWYQRVLSPLKPPVCRFYPSCSQYTFEAIARYGLAKGSLMGLGRFLRCHPFHPGGHDPVP